MIKFLIPFMSSKYLSSSHIIYVDRIFNRTLVVAHPYILLHNSHGYYRDVWVVKNFGLDENFMMKKSRYKYETKIGVFHSTLRDALIMERLTVSPRIINIYGHCGETVLVEAIPFEVEEYIVPGDGYIKQEDLHDKVDVTPLNKYTIEEKLQTAIEMAESLADLHGFKDGVM